MPLVVYALFDEAAPAERAAAAIQRAHGRGGEVVVQLHDRAPLDGNLLPEGATEFGRNMLIAMAAGGVFMAVAGGIAGAFDLLLGMTVAMGVGLGGVTGVLMGLVGAMQAGTRIPRAEIRALEQRMGGGRRLLLVELTRRDEARAVLDALDEFAPADSGSLGSL
ncbi:MAG: hypothetical protein K1X88_01580 [Nannocystaceae bacterium]|nr:hypothetical protein [Nannocystaceae bacterium]